MLTPEYLEKLPENMTDMFLQLEDDIIADVSRRISKDLELTATADYQINQLRGMGYDLSDIEKEIARVTKLSRKEVEDLLKESSYMSYENDKKLYKVGSKKLPEMPTTMNDFILATIRNSKFEMKNITNSLGIVDKGRAKTLTKYYQDSLDYAVIQLASGAYTRDQVVKQAVKGLADSGVRYIDYKSGHSNHMDVAVRRAVLTGTSQITGRMSEMNADLMDQDLMEITSHTGARPSHAEWQGQIVSRSGRRGYLSLSDIGYETGDGFKGWNCRHDWHAYFEGISVRAKAEKEPAPINYNDRTYTSYEASQYQRAIERRIRKSKRELIAYDSAGLEQDFINSSAKLQRQRDLYKDFSRKAGIRPKKERTQVYKYGRSISGKAVHAGRR